MILNPTEVVPLDGHLANEPRITISEPAKIATHFVRGEDSFGCWVTHFSSKQNAERWAAKYVMNRFLVACKDSMDAVLPLWKAGDYAGVIQAGNKCADFNDRFFIGEVRVKA